MLIPQKVVQGPEVFVGWATERHLRQMVRSFQERV